jgi:hypothetical protein
MLLGDSHLTYGLNIHPGESLAEVRDAIFGPAAAVKARLCPDRPFGLGLRLSARAAEELEPEVDAFRSELGSAGMYAFTVNGFPFGRFSGTRVKETVYEPDWTSPERVGYTLRLARILTALLPAGVDGSISTSPLVYGRAAPPAAVENLLATGRELSRLAAATGRTIRLAIEPEPGCAVETTGQAIALFERLRGTGDFEATGPLGVCLDTCHLATNFENPAESLRALTAAGIPVPKIQLSAALKVPAGEDAPALLAPYADEVYLHQTRVRTPEREILSWPDLPPALMAAPVGEWRVHFHVPLHTPPKAGLATTADLLDGDFLDLALRPGRHLEVETYTFAVLPEPAGDVVDSVTSELAWLPFRPA